MGKIIGLGVPNRKRPDKTAFNIRPRKLATWLNALPRANLGETAKQLYTVLQQTNQLAYPYQDRIRFLEILREPIEYVTSSMKKHFISVSLPLPEKSEQISIITKELFFNMAQGYKIALEDMLANNLIIFDKKTLALLTHRSIRYTGLNFLTCYQSYSPFSTNHWTDLHKLYCFAEKRNLLKTKVCDEQNVYIQKTSVSTEYARILLVSLASPYHLRQGETGKIYAALERWLNHPIIRTLAQNEKDSDKFIDNLAQAQAPTALSLALTEEIIDAELLRVIDTQVLAEKLEYELKNTEDVGLSTITSHDTMRPDLSHDLLQRLLIAWGVVHKRFFPRTDKNDPIQITIGLSAAHQLITQKAQSMDNGKYTNKYNDRAHFESTEIKINLKDPGVDSSDIWGLVYPQELTGLEPIVEQELSLQDSDPFNFKTVPTNTEAKQYQADNWLIINESAKGMMINKQGEFNNKAQVGELVSIRRQPKNRTERWSIGVIRWIRSRQDKSLQMGIETLNPNCAAIGIRATSTPNAPLQRTLMLPELINLKQSASLVTPPVPWREGHKITINMLGKDIPATLGKSVLNTGLFAQFEFKIITQTTSAIETTKTDQEQNFNQIWSSI